MPIFSNGNTNVANSPTVVTQFQYAEDAAHSSGDTGAFALAVRNTAQSALTSTDGDYSPFAVDTVGRLITAIQHTEDTGHSSGDAGAFVLGVRNDTPTSLTSTDLDYSPIAVDEFGRVLTVPLTNQATIAFAQVDIPTAGTRVQLATQAIPSGATVVVKAHPGNGAAFIYVGDSTVDSTNGFVLGAGDSVALAVTNVNIIYVDTDVSGSDVTWIVET